MRTAHYAAFETAVKTRVTALASLTFDGDVPLNADGTVRHGSYLVLHDMGFDSQDDDRLAINVGDAADGTYRVIARCIGETRAAVRAVADTVKTAMVGQRLVIAGRVCGLIEKDAGPDGIQRDDDVSPPLFWCDLDFIWRSQRA